MRISDSFFVDAKKILSPNFSEREKSIDLIVLHSISLPEGEYDNDNVEDLFMNKLNFDLHSSFQGLRNVKVSAHLYVKRDGTIIQFVPFNKCAWHAGESIFKGRKNCNEFSIGIEIQGKVDEEYTREQYENLKKIVDALKKFFQLNDVVAHSEISPERKKDPGPLFDWSKLDES